jgi:hypothetical protein
MFEQLNGSAKDSIIASGMKDFGPQVSSNVEQYTKNLGSLIPTASILDKFKSFLPTQALSSLTDTSKMSMASSVQNLIGGKLF